MAEELSIRDRYLAVIDQIVQATLKGKIRSKAQIYKMLSEALEPKTGEVFERCLGDRLTATQRDVDVQTDEFKHAKASRVLRALQSIQSEWERWYQDHRATSQLSESVQAVMIAEESDRLSVLLSILDPNQANPLTISQWRELATQLRQSAPSDTDTVRSLATGIEQGIQAWQHLEPHLVSWIYDQSQGSLGFEGVGQRGPWQLWSQHVRSSVSQKLLAMLALERSPVEWVENTEVQRELGLTALVELAILLRCVQQGLVNWFDKLVYDSKVGAKLSISTFLTFAVLWSQMATGLQQASLLATSSRQMLVQGCLQMTMQILRLLALRDYFPLYGGVFASFSGQYLRDALSYLDEPLRQAEGTQEKARILTLLGYSAKALGSPDRALAFHEEALALAQSAGDRPCEIANLNHLSRIHVGKQDYDEAIRYSQRAVILSRQGGDRPGEANALANLGYSEVFRAHDLEQLDADGYELAIDRLQEGLQLAEKLGDRQSQALCLSSLGTAQVMVNQPQQAIAYLESGIQAAQFTGDVYLQGMNLTYLAEAYYQLEQLDNTIYSGCLAMYLLEQIASSHWRQPAGLMRIVRGKLGNDAFQASLEHQRSQFIRVIGVDGYDHLPTLFEQAS